MTTWDSSSEFLSPSNAETSSSEPHAAIPDDSPSAAFSRRYERCFRRVFYYVSQRTSDRSSVEEIVASVLADNLDLLVAERSLREELTALKRSSDRELARRTLVAARASRPVRGRVGAT